MDLLYYAIKKARKEYYNNNRYKITELSTYNNKKFLLTQTELKFYKILKKVTDELNLTICPQVSLYEIINTYSKQEFNNISNKTIDFVITNENLEIKYCIELDDKTHNKQERIERDNFINNVFKKVNIKLIRIPVQQYYNIEQIKNALTTT